MMRKLLLFFGFLALVTSARGADAGAIVSISNIKNIVPGYSGSFDVVLNSSSTEYYTTLGLDVQLPDGFTYTGYTAGALLTESHASNIFRSDQGNNTSRFSSYANPTANFTAKQGVLLTIHFTVDAAATTGTAWIKNASFTLGTESCYATDASAELTVGNTVTFDETAANSFEAITGVDVTINRSLKADVWNTLVLPFSMTNDQLKSTFGNDVLLGKFNGYDTDDDDNIHVNFLSSESLDAHTPYIIKVSTPMTSFTVSGVSLSAATGNLTVNKGTNKKPKAMIGSYEPMTIDDGDLFLLNNQFKYSTGNSTIKAFRAYFSFTDFDYEATARTLTIDFFDMTTGLHNVSRVADADVNAYNLGGQQVNEAYKGVVVKNGKKMIQK